MSKRKFKNGDRVKIIDNESILEGMTGTIKDASNDKCLGIEFDEPVPGGHTCGGLCVKGYGWYCPATSLTHIEKAKKDARDEYHKIIIYKQGRTVTAKYINKSSDYTTTATAKCSPQDIFNFLTGAQIALARLAKAEGVKPVMLKEAFNFEII